MKIITYCNLYENENYKLLKKTLDDLKIDFINTHTVGVKWTGFFDRWTYIYDFLKNIDDDEDIGIIDGTDVFILNDLNKVKLDNGVIFIKKHSYNFLLKNTCNINAGVFFGKSKDIKKLCLLFIDASENEKKFFMDCDQSYLNFKINFNSCDLKFEDCNFIYMNSFNNKINENIVIYHAIGMSDLHLLKTKQNIKNYLNINLDLKFFIKRYFQYILKWFIIEMKILLKS